MLSKSELHRIGRFWTPPGLPKAGDKDFETKQAVYARALAEAEQQLGALAGRRLELSNGIGKIDEAQ